MSYAKPERFLSDREHDAARLHEAICDGRRQDAVDILNEMFPNMQFRSIREQQNLFPDRVPA